MWRVDRSDSLEDLDEAELDGGVGEGVGVGEVVGALDGEVDVRAGVEAALDLDVADSEVLAAGAVAVRPLDVLSRSA